MDPKPLEELLKRAVEFLAVVLLTVMGVTALTAAFVMLYLFWFKMIPELWGKL